MNSLPLKTSAALEPIAPSMPVSVSVSLPRLAVSVVAARSNDDLGGAAEEHQVDPAAAVELVVGGAAVEQVGAVAPVERVLAAQALEEVVAQIAVERVGGGGAGEHVVAGRGRGRERVRDLDRADVGQAAGGLRAGAGAVLAGGTGGKRVGAARARGC